MSKGASLVEFEHLPPGVFPIKDYPSLGATLVECEHAIEHRQALFGEDGRYRRGQVCRICKLSGFDNGFTQPVKMLARLPDGGSLTLF